MINISDVSLRFGERVVLKDISWAVYNGTRTGLVGANGAGKTTLLRMIAKEQAPGSGTIIVTKGDRIGYLPQDLVEIPDVPVMDFLRVRTGLAEIESGLDRVARDLAEAAPGSPECEKLLARHESLTRRFEMSDGFVFEAMARKVLKGLGFSGDDHLSRCGALSGGWKMRLLLASLLLDSPDILLLDEPTNHLDTESMEWLEGWLSAFTGTIIAVSHDRLFLDSVCSGIAELSLGKLSLFKGNFSTYVEESERRIEDLRRAQKLQKEELARLGQFIERFRYKASKAASVQSRVKHLEKIQLVEVEEDTQKVRFHFPPARRSGLDVMVLQNVTKSYGEKMVLRDATITVQRGEKIALVGVNGAGKSTLSRLLGRVESPTSGTVRAGHNVKIAFYSQESSKNLDYDRTVWETVSSGYEAWNERDKRNLLGGFLFGGDSIHKPVSVLSGGEKSRLALLKLMLEEANLLVLDEPTNHLDMRTKDLFQRALLEFDGTLVIVSHDRYFLDNLATKVIEIYNGELIVYPGNYSWFVEKRKERIATDPRYSEDDAADAAPRAPRDRAKDQRREDARRRNELYRRKKTVLDVMAPLEARIERLEEEQAERDLLLCDPSVLADSARVTSLLIQREEASRMLEGLMKEWEELAEEIDRIEKTG